MRLFNIDGDELLYRVTAATETVVDWGDGPERLSTMRDVQFKIEEIIDHLAQTLGGDLGFIALSSTINFRKIIYPAYKSHRNPEKPALFEEAKDWLIEDYGTICTTGLEADDVLGRTARPDTVIVSSDKDFDTIPDTWRYSLYHKELIHPKTLREADRALAIQALTGDRTDNYPGIPGVGIKRAEKLLETKHEEGLLGYEAIQEIYVDKGLTPADAFLNYTMARILRPGDSIPIHL